MNSLTLIRKLERPDLPTILELVKDLAEYEKAFNAVTATLDDYEKYFDQSLFEGYVAVKNEKTIVGVALFYYAWSTWKGKMLYLEDFIVKESERGNGIGRILFDRVINHAKETGSVQMKWQVLDWNIPAINFYNKYNAEFDKDWWNGKIIFNLPE